MAAAAVASVVIEKLALIEKSLIVDKVIDQVLEEIRTAARLMMRDAEEHKLDCNEEGKKWTCDYLGILYQVEDAIETFALARHQRKSSLLPIGGCFNHLGFSQKSLLKKMLEIQIKIKELNDKKASAQPLQHDEDQEEEKEANASIDWPRLEKSSSSNGRAISQVKVMPALACANSVRRIRSALSFNDCLRNFTDERSITHNVSLLSESDRWEMFLKNARLPETSIDNPSLKQKILEKCDGLPLRIVLLGGLLSTKKESSWNEWFRVVDQSNRDIFSLSYDELLVHSKLCLLYLALFPKDYDIPVRRLLRLWLAEGFVKRSPEMIPEDVVQEYFEDLVKRNMIRISKLRSDGSARGCRLLGALHDNLSSKAQDISLFHIHRNSNSCGAASHRLSVRRIVEYDDVKNCNPSEFQNARSYISFNFQKKDTPATEVRQFVSKLIGKKGFGLLRVLDLECVYKPSLPDNLGDLFHLRYLGLRWTFLDYLPSSVGTLTYLETLDLKHTYINSLPSSIWKLKHLRHLNLNEILLDMPSQPPNSCLLTLWGLVIDHKSPVRNCLDRLRDLRELGITLHLSTDPEDKAEIQKKKEDIAEVQKKKKEDIAEVQEKKKKDIADWVATLTALQSLRLRSKDGRGCPMDLCLKPLSGLEKLSHLYLLGNLQKLPDIKDFPSAVKVITLSVSRLTEDPMPILGRLPSLTVLRLLADSYLGQQITCPLDADGVGGFRKLQVLKLWMLKELQEWELKTGAMQSLRKLNIRCCHRLKNIPQRLMESSTLEELILTNMPDAFVADVKLYRTATVKNFDSLPWKQDILSDGGINDPTIARDAEAALAGCSHIKPET
ncbi:putative disease resistance RPP13-like protein 2 [Cornus florida]|uniref:putative disease resistance RPP13-like protein 2 n=1 Tax=Cornus florida TaxID=4283 RepID=UPI0028A196FC|nr:putative disease resistance RPP13-like protein 2 [Cornus florida]